MNLLSKKSLGISGTVIAFAFVMAAITPSFMMTEQVQNTPGFNLPISEALGETTTLENAKKANSDLKSPSYLPMQVELIEIRSSENGDYVSMLYSSKEISDLGSKHTEELQNLDLKVFAQKLENNPIPYHGVVEKPVTITSEKEGQETKTYVLETNVPEFDKLKINSLDAVFIPGNESLSIPNDLKWWENGILYSIHSDFDKSEMIRIAESME